MDDPLRAVEQGYVHHADPSSIDLGFLMRRRTFAVIAFVGLLGLSVAACSGNGESANPGLQQAPEDTTPAARGGTLKVGTDAEADGFLPFTNRWTPSSWMIAKSMIDPLVAVNDKGDAVPYLAESVTPNADFTAWDIKTRSGVIFHNNEPVNADAVLLNLRKSQAAGLTNAALTYVKSVDKVDDSTVRVTMVHPWATFPQILTGQIGMMVAPAQINANDPANPIGSGPFKFKTWQRDQKLTVERWGQYWQKDAKGATLPYLDGVEFSPYPDVTSKVATFESNGINLMITSDSTQIAHYQERGSGRPSRSLSDVEGGDEAAIVFNTQTGVFSSQDLRVAAAKALDRQGYSDTVDEGVRPVANGPFTKGSLWNESNTYPTYDPEGAKALVDAYQREHGPVTVKLGAVAGGSLKGPQYIQEAWNAVGLHTEIDSISEAAFALNVVTGKDDALEFGFWYEVDPDPLFHFLHSSSIKGPGEISLNFSRFADPAIDKALEDGRATADVSKRQEAYQRLWDEMGRTVPVLFLNHVKWLVIWGDQVHGVGEAVLPDGSKAKPVIWGAFFLTRVWMSS